jgi:hypothetical protein
LINQRFPDGVMIPQAVWKEVVETGRGRIGAESVAKASLFVICVFLILTFNLVHFPYYFT